ncbi:MAG: hypothetical protein M4579_003121 [Chaenotheca gracillima]|nr:MAG: hypothetical protein M4579_003121 [Chaenotheca gracillima]
MRKVASEEINSIEGLRKVYTNPDRDREAVLRVFHVQNAWWATHFLLRKFNIDNRDNLVGTDFGNWVRHKRPERRNGKPVLNGKTWRTQHDPWRGISRTAFGVDYLKEYRMKTSSEREDPLQRDVKMMELNCLDSDENPLGTYDVYVQRLAVYIQHKDSAPAVPTDMDIENPYNEADSFRSKGVRHKDSYIPILETLDNGNAIIIFENSQSGSIEDTLISAREAWESRWRRLPFYLAYESHDISNDDHMAVECMKMILQDVFKSLVESWDAFLDVCYNHVSLLEDKIYEQPADESRAPELWTNSSQWLKVEKLMLIHMDIVKELRGYLSELSDDDEVDPNWLESSPSDFERLSNLVQEDLIKPTTSLADLMYKSVGIRDSRHSLQLGTSMWRLSWITFIFLPLTFMVGFFGMNVDTFAGDPSIKWYFVAAVPFMLLILIFWFFIKHMLARRRQTPYQRGIYEHFFHDLATKYPTLWTRAGPRSFISGVNFIDRVKWRLITSWAAPNKTIRMGPNDGEDDPEDGLGSWSRLKRYLIRRWTADIRVANQASLDNLSDSLLEQGGDASADDIGFQSSDMVLDGLGVATELLALPGAAPESRNANGMLPGNYLRVPARRPPRSVERSRAQPHPRPRPVSNAESSKSAGTGSNSEIMVEEQEPGWLRRASEEIGREQKLKKEKGQKDKQKDTDLQRSRTRGTDIRSSVERRSQELISARQSADAERKSQSRSPGLASRPSSSPGTTTRERAESEKRPTNLSPVPPFRFIERPESTPSRIAGSERESLDLSPRTPSRPGDKADGKGSESHST